MNELNKLFSIISTFKLSATCEFTFECNIESIDEEKLKLLKKNKVNRLSIGVETFNPKFLNFLNRKHTKEEVIKKIQLAKNIGFNNINIDLIYALPHETLKDLEEDIDIFLSLDIEHISTYSLIIEPHTKLYIESCQNIDSELDFKMYELICDKLQRHGFNHYEISNFSRIGYESKHNLVYWNNLEYYGFGAGASGYINSKRYDNTRNIQKYLQGKFIDNIYDVSLNEQIENEFMLGFRKIKGINKNAFLKKYNFSITDFSQIKKLILENKLIYDNSNIYINPKYLYIENQILVDLIDEDYVSQIKNK